MRLQVRALIEKEVGDLAPDEDEVEEASVALVRALAQARGQCPACAKGVNSCHSSNKPERKKGPAPQPSSATHKK